MVSIGWIRIRLKVNPENVYGKSLILNELLDSSRSQFRTKQINQHFFYIIQVPSDGLPLEICAGAMEKIQLHGPWLIWQITAFVTDQPFIFSVKKLKKAGS